jgi:hypothetical protein
MRHLWSLLLALALTPLIYVAAGVSAARLSDTRGFGAAAAIGLSAGLVAGGLYAALVMLPLSPVGPVVSGTTYLGVTIWFLVDRTGFESFLPADLFHESGALHRPVGMGTALLAGPLLLTVFSSRRWRGNEEPAAPAPEAEPVYPRAVGSATPVYPEAVAPTVLTYAPTTTLPVAGSQPAPTYEPPVYTPPTR